MLPLQQAYEVKQSIIEYLKATFDFKEKAVSKAFYDFIESPKDGIFKGPYISLKLPFETETGGEEIPLQIKPKLSPYKHQFQAFQRLTSENGHKPEPTLLTTGTGSGKTESFLYPILDYCYKNKGKAGIKVIILYPMNALATDQAKRLAEIIYNDPLLKDNVTAGLFIGEGKDKTKFPKTMGDSHIIENRDEILTNPPDILLTNFKMLDYGLLRHQFHNLWKFNFDDPSLLQFLVLDELHTYDGAQGTDVANLIRRLKLKLNIPQGQLCPVGTSATIGKGVDSVRLLTEYASSVFGESFDSDSVIVEHRLSADQFFTIPDNQLDTFIPRIVGLQQSRLGINENYLDYIIRQKKLWQLPEDIQPLDLADQLKQLKIVKDLCDICSKSILPIPELIDRLNAINPKYAELQFWDEANEFSPKDEVITSILALIVEAKMDEKGKIPFLFLQIQIWVRELSGLLREFSAEPTFTWKDKISLEDDNIALPPYFCRECGSSGWMAVKHDNRDKFEGDPTGIYEHYFTNHKNTYFINTKSDKHTAVKDFDGEEISPYVHQVDLKFKDTESTNYLHVLGYRKVKDQKSIHVCPECNTQNTLSIIGTRIATLNSVSVSQVLSSDLDKRGEQYRKVLEFTNGVQDAAHQAGFVQARNYRFTFRTSLQKVIKDIGKPIDLVSLSEAFINYWKTHADPTGNGQLDAYFQRFFPSDYIGKSDVEMYRNEQTKQFSKKFETEFDLRVYWEVLSEFGYNAQIGRTLEKTGSSAVSFDLDELKMAYTAMLEWMKSNQMENVDEASFIQFLNLVLHRMRIRGALNHPYLNKFRQEDLSFFNLNWSRDSRHFLNRTYFERNSRIPKLVCTNGKTKNVLDSTFAKTTNWFHTYFVKSFELVPSIAAMINEFYAELFKILSEQDLIDVNTSKEGENFAINPSKIKVGNEVVSFECSQCSSSIQVHSTDNLLNGSVCMDYRCTGKYFLSPKKKLNYYNLVYNRTNSPRIFASEHTGVLERQVRENVEHDFKNRPNYNSLNVLVATSTLEMGIDIGSLNTAINTSVPPLTSNFLQRIGRAGRSSGTALIETFAQNKAHDLFYYQEPMEMMQGDINTPGCFLNAKDILSRHFTAYCFDTWTKANPVTNQIPNRITDLNLIANSTTDIAFFVNRLVTFIVKDVSILDRFFSLYKGQIDQSLEDSIRKSLDGDFDSSFAKRLRGVFEDLKKEIFFLLDKEKEIEAVIKDKNLGKEDDERKILEQEKKSIWILKKSIQGRQIIEFLTNEGVLPNYAFPETGVTLNAQVYGFKPEGAEQEPVTKSYEIVRSASAALKEYAPDNFFYSQGNKLEISGLNTYDWFGEKSSLVNMRFCSNCDHLEDEIKAVKGPCPKCGHESWNAASNKHKFARMHSVKSVNSSNKSALKDSKDERDQKNYMISTHFNFNPNSIEGTWGMKSIPFGIEYVKDVELTKVNLGINLQTSNHLTINQIEDVPRHGFVTCKNCGKSTPKPREVLQFDKKFHYGYCKHKDIDYSDKKDSLAVFEEVYLYRQMQTEAIKILLPVQEFENEATQEMFKAGLELGLKKYYKGNPDHIAFEFYSEFNAVNERFDRYLVMYDTVPGGTGYLQKLFDTTEFTQLLTQAYDTIRTCSCKSEGKDGCYRCILSYSNQYIRQSLSRSAAEDLFSKIVLSAKDWEPVSQGISSLTESGMIEESELEKKFPMALKKFVERKDDEKYSFKSFKDNGITCYQIGLPKNEDIIYFTITPQVTLGEIHGIDKNTRADFMIKCSSIMRNGEQVEDSNELMAYKEVVVYLDGYRYHASKEHMRFYEDLEIRKAINSSPNMYSWSLSWDDMKRFESNKEEECFDELSVESKKYAATVKKLLLIANANNIDTGLIQAKNSMERLIWFLTNSNTPNIDNYLSLYLACFQEEFGKISISEKSVTEIIEGQPFNDSMKITSSADSYMLSELSTSNELFSFKSFVKMAGLELKSNLEVKQLDEIEKKVWEEFLRLYSVDGMIN